MIYLIDCHLRKTDIRFLYTIKHKMKMFLLLWKYPLEHRRFGSHVLQGSKFSASNQNSPFSAQIFAVNRWWLQSTPNLITHSNFVCWPPTLEKGKIKTDHILCYNILKIMTIQKSSNLIQLFCHCFNSNI